MFQVSFLDKWSWLFKPCLRCSLFSHWINHHLRIIFVFAGVLSKSQKLVKSGNCWYFFGAPKHHKTKTGELYIFESPSFEVAALPKELYLLWNWRALSWMNQSETWNCRRLYWGSEKPKWAKECGLVPFFQPETQLLQVLPAPKGLEIYGLNQTPRWCSSQSSHQTLWRHGHFGPWPWRRRRASWHWEVVPTANCQSCCLTCSWFIPKKVGIFGVGVSKTISI